MKRVYSDCFGDSTGDSIGLSKRERWPEPNQCDETREEQFRHSALLHRRVLRPPMLIVGSSRIVIQEGIPTMRKEGFPGGQRPFPAPCHSSRDLWDLEHLARLN